PIGAGFRKIGGRSGRPGSDACGTPLGEPPLATVRIRVTMNRLPSARTVVRLITPFLVAACQPQARRLLLLDLALSDPVVLNGTARPWADAGYEVQYRRFYPHLTRADLPQFRTLLFLLGREPEAASDALTAGDVALLDEWVRRGGVVVLGYDGDGEGYLDRWTANRWLAYEGAGISIGDRVLEDTTTRVLTTGRAQPWAVARPVGDEPLGSAYDPFPLDRNHVVVTREPTQLLALTSHRAFVRASRECPRLAAPAGPARLVDAALGDTGGAARPPAARHARLARHVPRRGRLQLALRRRLSGGGRLDACPLVGAGRRPARLERRRKPARAHERRLDPGVRLWGGPAAARRLLAWPPRRGVAGSVRARHGAVGRGVRSRRPSARATRRGPANPGDRARVRSERSPARPARPIPYPRAWLRHGPG